jgi:hypothetical protein
MNHKEYHELLKDLKYSGWVLLAKIIIAIGVVLFIMTDLKK